MKVFLGGTCGKSEWRDRLIRMLFIDYFNPVVDDWTPELQAEEIRQRSEECDFCLYTITPHMESVYSIAEAVDDSNKRPGRTIFCLLAKEDDRWFGPDRWESLKAVARMIKANGGHVFYNLEDCACFLNCGDRREEE